MNASEVLFEVFISTDISSVPSWPRFVKTDPKSNRSDLPILTHWVQNSVSTPVGKVLLIRLVRSAK